RERWGWTAGARGPLRELGVGAVPGSAIAARLDEELFLRDRLPLGDPPPDGAEALLTVAWHAGERVVAFRRRVGAGHVVHLGLGARPEVYAEPAYRQVVYRC